MKINFNPYQLLFKVPSGTSRGILTSKNTYIIEAQFEERILLGECNLFKGLSAEDSPNFENKLIEICSDFNEDFDWWESLRNFPSIQFAFEQIVKNKNNPYNYSNKNTYNPIYYDSEFTAGKVGIPINGLIWMGDESYMKAQIKAKLTQNFKCIKLKIGVNWETEKEILKNLRNEFSKEDLEIRVDANGAFDFEEAKTVLNELAELNIHSIEQPLKARNFDEMAELCNSTPTPIALDEELIGVFDADSKKELLLKIKPHYIILKPSLVGGWRGSEEWIKFAEELNIKWWITSALESNIGLNAIAQWTYSLNNPLPQGLGTGGLFTNNFPTRLKVLKDELFFI